MMSESHAITEFSDILLENGIEDKITKVEIVKPNLIGDHFASEVFNITINFENKIPPLNLFKKTHTSNPEHSKLMKKLNVFEKEAHFYNDILPSFDKFEFERNGTHTTLDLFPKAYKASGEQLLMENLSLNGFGTINKLDKMTFDQSRLILINAAKFHAVSYTIMQEIGLEDFKNLYPLTKEFLFTRNNNDVSEFFQGTIDKAHLILNKNDERHAKAIETITRFQGKGMIHEFLFKILIEEENLFNVLNHGDFWIANIMQRLDKDGNPIEARFVDMQAIRVCSPNTDVGNFIFTSVKREIRREKLRELLRVYFDNLKENVENLGGVFAFTFDEFVRDFQKKFYLGYFCGLITVFATLGKFNPSEGGEFIGGFTDAIQNAIIKNPKIAETIVEEVVSLCEELENIVQGKI